jgi:DNA-binding beta-propeller fold protein YncE
MKAIMKFGMLVILFVLVDLALFMGCSSNNSPASPGATPGIASSPTNSPTPTPTATPTNSPCGYPGFTCTFTATFTNTSTPTATSTPTITFTPTLTFTKTPTNTRTYTFTPTNTSTPLYNASVTFGNSSTMYDTTAIRYTGGNLWMSMVGMGNTVQEWTTVGGQIISISTFNGSQGFSTPWGIGIDPSNGNVYVANQYNSQINVFSATGTYLATFGTTEYNNDHWAMGVAVNSSGTTVYALDFLNKAFIYTIGGTSSSPTYSYQATFANSGTGQLNRAFNLCMDNSNNVLIPDYNGHRVAVYDFAGNYQKSITSADLDNPADVAVDPTGNLYVADSSADQIYKYDPSGVELGYFGRTALGGPQGITLGPSGYIYVLDHGNDQVVVFH